MTTTTAHTTTTTTTVASTTTECLQIGDQDIAVVACPTTKRKKRLLSADEDISFSRIESHPTVQLRYQGIIYQDSLSY